MKSDSKKYKNLYHYTSFETSIKILQSDSLRATHRNFLNDFSEGTQAIPLLHKALVPATLNACKKLFEEDPTLERRLKEIGPLEGIIQEETSNILEAFNNKLINDFYISSFCGETGKSVDEDGLLSQWRAYGQGGGVALVFDAVKLKELLVKEEKVFNFSFNEILPVYYEEDLFLKALAPEIEELSVFTEGFIYARAQGSQEVGLKSMEKVYFSFLKCLASLKHFGFHEENEARIVVYPIAHTKAHEAASRKTGLPIKKTEKQIQFRVRGQIQVPFIEIFKKNEESMPVNQLKDLALPIDRIIIGPHKEQSARADALRILLRYTDIKVTSSSIPYIGE